MADQQQPLNFEPWPKQKEIFYAFEDATTTECLFGGSINCGKTYILCAFIIQMCLKYPGIRWGLGRTDITNLKKTTLDIGFWKVCRDWGIIRGTDSEALRRRECHVIMKDNKNEIEFINGSKVILLDLFQYPSDPSMTSLSGHGLTGACIDEAGECKKEVKDKLFERIGRWMNKEYKIKPFLLMSCNPTKNFCYDEFYKPWKEGTLPPNKKYVFTTMLDVPEEFDDIHEYKERQREVKTDADYQRMVLGNWDYEDYSDALISRVNIDKMFTTLPTTGGTRYISADIALEGSDKLVYCVWDGLTLLRVHAIDKCDAKEALRQLQELMKIFQVDERNVCYDFDGLGQFIKGWLPNARPINNNAKALLNENYENLKTQMYFKLATLINEGKICVLDKNYKEQIIRELEQVRKKETADGRKVGIISKAEMKRGLGGKSPDFADALAYRMLFEIKSVYSGKYYYKIA